MRYAREHIFSSLSPNARSPCLFSQLSNSSFLVAIQLLDILLLQIFEKLVVQVKTLSLISHA